MAEDMESIRKEMESQANVMKADSANIEQACKGLLATSEAPTTKQLLQMVGMLGLSFAKTSRILANLLISVAMIDRRLERLEKRAK
jgi:hypothetical protein